MGLEAGADALDERSEQEEAALRMNRTHRRTAVVRVGREEGVFKLYRLTCVTGGNVTHLPEDRFWARDSGGH